MKRFGITIGLLLFFVLVSCKGDRGPQGPAGINILGQVFETTVSFNPGNNFSAIVDFPSNVEVYEADAVLVYLLEEVVDDNVDVWTPLPQTYFVDGFGTMIYSFNHTFLDVNVFLDGDFYLGDLSPTFTQNQTFRIAVVPSEFANDYPSMEELVASDKVEWIK